MNELRIIETLRDHVTGKSTYSVHANGQAACTFSAPLRASSVDVARGAARGMRLHLALKNEQLRNLTLNDNATPRQRR